MNMKAERAVYTVGRLNAEARMLLETGLPALWVEGEISNFAAPCFRALVFHAEGSRGADPLRHVPRGELAGGIPAAGWPADAAARPRQPL